MFCIFKKCELLLLVLTLSYGGGILFLSPIPCVGAANAGGSHIAGEFVAREKHEGNTTAGKSFKASRPLKTVQSYTTESQGLRITAAFSKPAKWFTLERGVLLLREPSRDENLGIVVRLEDCTTGRPYPAAVVKALIWDSEFQQCLLTTTTLAPVWNGREIEFMGNFSVPSEDHEKHSASVMLVVEPSEVFGRSAEVPESFFRLPVILRFGPLDFSGLIAQEIRGEKQRKPAPTPATGRHPPVEPTPYPGMKTPSAGQNNH